jgi:NitT/TauT family transport system substrate-binding protein
MFSSCNSCSEKKKSDLEIVNLRLQWYPHSQFAGFIVAKEMGFYEEYGLDVRINPGGPNIKSHVSVAAGTDDIGIALPNQIIAAQSNNVPLVIIAQMFQDSPNRYILKKENSINDLTDLKGKKVGVWLGGDEAEFLAMLKHKGMSDKDLQIIPQEISIVPFLEDQYILSQVTSYGEMNFLAVQGWTKDKFQILDPRDYNSAILGDLLFCKEDYLESNEETVSKFLEATIEGWNYCITNTEQALDIIMKSNSELSRESQILVMESVLELITTGDATTFGFGYINPDELKNTERILYESNQIERRVDVSKAYNNSALEQISKEKRLLKKKGG